jgi:tRNA dimethylallyltransferase
VSEVIILLGPTGVGKTSVSILLAKKLDTEIISADSMQVYQYMDIGTAKPSKNELKTVRHHLIDIVSPSESFSAGRFREEAIAIINKLHNKNKVPLVVGGTGLYIRSLTKGLFEGPGADESLREQLKLDEQRYGKGYLYNKLKTIDPEAAARIKPNDLRRIIRALEVSLKEKRGISKIQRELTRPPAYEFIKIGLTRDRKELYRLIEERVDRMIQDGLLEETKKLLTMNPNKTALQALGYKEMMLYLNGTITMDKAVRLTKKRTKMFAKRQFTWFKKEPDINWVDITGITDTDRIFKKVINSVEILKKIIYSYSNGN